MKKTAFLRKNIFQLVHNALGLFWKIQDTCYNMCTEIFKIEDEMSEKIKPKFGNPCSNQLEKLEAAKAA